MIMGPVLFVIGAVVGGVVSFVLDPRHGKQRREQIIAQLKSRMNEAGQMAEKQAKEFSDKAKVAASDAKQKIEQERERVARHR